MYALCTALMSAVVKFVDSDAGWTEIQFYNFKVIKRVRGENGGTDVLYHI